jgi:hypothetical protein
VFQKQKQRHFIDCEKRRKAKVGQRRGLSGKKLRKNEKREENSCAKSQNQKKKKKRKSGKIDQKVQVKTESKEMQWII